MQPVSTVRWLAFLTSNSQGTRFIYAERLFALPVAGHAVRPGSASIADKFELAAPALAFQHARVAQLGKQLGRFPDFLEALAAQVSGFQRQVAARLDYALVRDEADAGSGQATARHLIQIAWMAAGMT
jgi:hypothetical protein